MLSPYSYQQSWKNLFKLKLIPLSALSQAQVKVMKFLSPTTTTIVGNSCRNLPHPCLQNAEINQTQSHVVGCSTMQHGTLTPRKLNECAVMTKLLSTTVRYAHPLYMKSKVHLQSRDNMFAFCLVKWQDYNRHECSAQCSEWHSNQRYKMLET